MIITYHGHSCFKLKGKAGVAVCDPYSAAVGWPLPTLAADVVTSSHNHFDHAALDSIRPTARRDKPFLITQAGEYEVGGISVFGVPTFHDDQQGVVRGSSIVFSLLVDGIRVCHLGDLGHLLTSEQTEAIGSVDVLLIPVGGEVTLNPEQAVKVIHHLEPSLVIPMHYRTDKHEAKVFGGLHTLPEFLKEYGVEVAPVPTLEIASHEQLPEETTVVVLSEQL